MLESHLMEQVTSVNLGLQRSVRHGAVISQSPRTSFHHCLFCNMPWTQEVAVQARLRGRRLHCAASMRKAIGRAKWLQVGRCGHCIFGIAFSAPFLRFPFQRFLVRSAHFDSCLRACALVPMGLGEDLFPDFIGVSSHALQYSLCNSSF